VGKKKPLPSEQQLAQLVRELRAQYKVWQVLREPDGRDPIWMYSCDMERIHNSISCLRDRIKELCDESGLPLPEDYALPVPPYDLMDCIARAAAAREKEVKAQIAKLVDEVAELRDLQHMSRFKKGR